MSSRRRPHPASQPEPSGDLISRTLQLAGLGGQLWRLEIFRRWPEAVGPKVAARTQPQTFSRGTLVIRAASATWQNELMFLRKAIIARLNSLLDQPRVTELKVLSGHLPADAPKIAKALPKPSAVATTAAHDCATCIADDDVRAAFATFMAQTIDHQVRQRSSPSGDS